MSRNVLPFHPSKLTDFAEIPSPINAQPGDSYLRLDVTGDGFAHMGLFAGAILVVLLDAIRDGWPHLIERYCHPFAAFVTHSNTTSVSVLHWEAGAQLKTYPTESIRIVGVIVEMYPLGIPGPRVVYHPQLKGAAEHLDMDFPLVNVAAN